MLAQLIVPVMACICTLYTASQQYHKAEADAVIVYGISALRSVPNVVKSISQQAKQHRRTESHCSAPLDCPHTHEMIAGDVRHAPS